MSILDSGVELVWFAAAVTVRVINGTIIIVIIRHVHSDYMTVILPLLFVMYKQTKEIMIIKLTPIAIPSTVN